MKENDKTVISDEQLESVTGGGQVDYVENCPCCGKSHNSEYVHIVNGIYKHWCQNSNRYIETWFPNFFTQDS